MPGWQLNYREDQLTQEFKDYWKKHRLSESTSLIPGKDYFHDPTRPQNEYVQVYYEVEGKRKKAFHDYWVNKGGLPEGELPKYRHTEVVRFPPQRRRETT